MGVYPATVRRVIAPLWAYKERSPYLRHLRYLEESQYYPLERIVENQWKRLKALISHANRNVPFYRKRFERVGLRPEDVTTWEEFSRLPILTKEDIRENQSDLVANNIQKDKFVAKKTSGSTGVSLRFFVDEDSLQWKRGCTARHDRWAGWDLGERVAALWGNPDHYVNWRMRLRNALLDRYSYLDTLKMDDKAIDTFYKTITKKPPAVLFGHAHSLYLFARYLKKKNLTPPIPKGAISTAMVLHSHERRLIEEVFGCKVYNRYGCEEVSLIASECERHEGLHMNLDTLIIETLRDGVPAKPGETGAIHVTDLSNYAMPFIRYRVGDVGVIAKKKCSCKRTFPLFETLEGREADYVVTPEGEYVSGISLTENFAMYLKEVKQIQLVQDKIDHILVRIVRDQDKNGKVEEAVKQLVSERFSPSMKHSIEYLDAIPQERSGKYRFCISKVARSF